MRSVPHQAHFLRGRRLPLHSSVILSAASPPPPPDPPSSSLTLLSCHRLPPRKCYSVWNLFKNLMGVCVCERERVWFFLCVCLCGASRPHSPLSKAIVQFHLELATKSFESLIIPPNRRVSFLLLLPITSGAEPSGSTLWNRHCVID